jgi:hypothetical protein
MIFSSIRKSLSGCLDLCSDFRPKQTVPDKTGCLLTFHVVGLAILVLLGGHATHDVCHESTVLLWDKHSLTWWPQPEGLLHHSPQVLHCTQCISIWWLPPTHPAAACAPSSHEHRDWRQRSCIHAHIHTHSGIAVLYSPCKTIQYFIGAALMQPLAALHVV